MQQGMDKEGEKSQREGCQVRFSVFTVRRPDSLLRVMGYHYKQQSGLAYILTDNFGCSGRDWMGWWKQGKVLQ